MSPGKPAAALRPTIHLQRRPQLDGLRAVAMAGVFLDHFAWKQMQEWDVIGWLGLQLFLAMSGFLTTAILLRDHAEAEEAGRSRWMTVLYFYIRRALRLFPTYYLVLMLSIAADLPHAREAFVWLATYTANLYVTMTGHLDSLGSLLHLWSLSVQEQFYIAWALIMVLVSRRWLIFVACAMVLTGPTYRFIGMRTGLSGAAVHFFTPACVDSLGLGILLCVAYATPALRPRLGPWLAGLAVLGAIVAKVAMVVDETTPTFTVVAFSGSVGLMACWFIYAAMEGIKGPVGWILGWRPIVYVGRISYGLFVYQFLAPLLLRPVIERLGLVVWPGGLQAFLLYTAVTVALASLSWHVIEKPIHTFAQRFRTA